MNFEIDSFDRFEVAVGFAQTLDVNGGPGFMGKAKGTVLTCPVNRRDGEINLKAMWRGRFGREGQSL